MAHQSVGLYVGDTLASPSTLFQIDDHPDHASSESGSRFDRLADDAFSRSISNNLRISGGIRQFGTLSIPFGQLRVALQLVFDCLHRGLAEYNALGIDRAAECDDGMDPLPRHTLSPLQPRLPIHQLRPIPVPRAPSNARWDDMCWGRVENTAAGWACQARRQPGPCDAKTGCVSHCAPGRYPL